MSNYFLAHIEDDDHPFDPGKETIVADYYSFDYDSWREKRITTDGYADSYECLEEPVKRSIVKMARSAPKRSVMAMLFGGSLDKLNPVEQAEFDWYYEMGSRIGEYQVSQTLFNQAVLGDIRAMDRYLVMKAGWSSEGTEEESEESPFNIILDGIAHEISEGEDENPIKSLGNVVELRGS